MARKRRSRSHAHPPACALPHDEDGKPSEAGLDAHLEREIRPVVAAAGLAVQHITTGDMRTGFCYTIGLTDIGHPELLIAGFHPVIASMLVQYVAAHLRDHYQPGEVFDRMRLLLPVGPEGTEVPFWLLAPTPEEDRDAGPGMAKAYYERWIPHLRVKPAGWPCNRCTAQYDQRTACTCKFPCTWHLCAIQEEEPQVIEEVGPGQYQISVVGEGENDAV